MVGAALAKRFGWKIGDRIPLKSSIFPGNWEFNLDAIYHGKRAADDESQFWLRWDRVDEQLPERRRGNIGWYVVRLNNPDDAAKITKTIDQMFANSPFETKTETESSFAASFVKQMGNVEFLILSIGSVVFFTLLLVTGNTMAIAVRERTAELAVLKAIGYSDRFVLIFVLAESVIIAAFGGGLGLFAAKLFSILINAVPNPLINLLPYFFLSPSAMLAGMGLALVVGTVSGILPAFAAMQLRVVDALRRV